MNPLDQFDYPTMNRMLDEFIKADESGDPSPQLFEYLHECITKNAFAIPTDKEDKFLRAVSHVKDTIHEESSGIRAIASKITKVCEQATAKQEHPLFPKAILKGVFKTDEKLNKKIKKMQGQVPSADPWVEIDLRKLEKMLGNVWGTLDPAQIQAINGIVQSNLQFVQAKEAAHDQRAAEVKDAVSRLKQLNPLDKDDNLLRFIKVGLARELKNPRDFNALHIALSDAKTIDNEKVERLNRGPLNTFASIGLKTMNHILAFLSRNGQFVTNLPLNYFKMKVDDFKAMLHFCPNLESIRIPAIGFDVSCVAEMAKLNRLKDLNFSSNTVIDDDVAVAIAEQLKSLTTINLCDCQISDQGGVAIAKGLPKLEKIDLSLSRVSNRTVEALATHCKSLKSIDLGGIQNVDDATAATLVKNNPSLEHIDFSSTSIGEQTLVAIATHCNKLKSINLSKTQVGDIHTARVVASNPGLEVIDFSSTRVGDETLRMITTLKAPRVLSLYNNRFSPAVLNQFEIYRNSLEKKPSALF